MFKALARLVLVALVALLLASCGDEATLPVAAGTGPHSELPPPVQTFLPTVVLPRAKGWPEGVTPKPAEGFKVEAFATRLDHPRWLYVLPNGDVLVAESSAPPQPGLGGSLMGWIMKVGMRWAGATRSDRTQHRSGSPSITVRCFLSATAAAPLSVSTALGTEIL